MTSRRQHLVNCWSRNLAIENSPLTENTPFSEAVNLAVPYLASMLFHDSEKMPHSATNHALHEEAIGHELKQYLETGNCGQGKDEASAVNPTLLQPKTGRWIVDEFAFPFCAYLPLSVKEVDQCEDASGIVLAHCQSVLKKLLTSLRSRREMLKFIFYPCDALAFCYKESPEKFDLIDTSNLADHIGLVNLLNAAPRKLRSDQSVLFTERLHWTKGGPDMAVYLQKILCCPLSLIPTLYGLRLMDNVELGTDTSNSFCIAVIPPSRLRWKKAPPLIGIPSVLSQSIQSSLQRLKSICFLMVSNGKRFFETRFHSPLTFCYVLSDLCRRGGVQNPSALMESLFFGLAPVFKKSLDTIQVWMHQRPVWQVKVAIPFSVFDSNKTGPILRLVLVPTSDFFADPLSEPTMLAKFLKMNSAENHFIDNVELNFKLKSKGGIDQVEISFLLAERSLLDTHCGIVVDNQPDGGAIFVIGRLDGRRCQVEPFDLPYPWDLERPVESSQSPGNSEMIAESCQETEDAYIIHFKIPSVKRSKAPSGKSKNY